MRRHKVDILKLAKTKDGYGGMVDSWIPFREKVWASKNPIIGKEFYSGLTSDVQIDAKFTTGYIPGIKSDMRLKHGSDIYEIIGQPININDRNMELLYYCRLVN